jgi:hypothetical protein
MNTTEEKNKHLKVLLRHIDNVRQNCIKLGDILIEKGEVELGLNLIANGYSHDNSKFYGIEWLYLNDDSKTSHPELFKAAHIHHVSHNKHHPEAWVGGIHEMDRLHRCEMVCDWAARSSEFGTDLRAFLKDKATKRFDMTIQSKAYREVKEIMDLFLDTPFK